MVVVVLNTVIYWGCLITITTRKHQKPYNNQRTDGINYMYDFFSYVVSKSFDSVLDNVSNRDESRDALTRVLRRVCAELQQHSDLYESFVLEVNKEAILQEIQYLLTPDTQPDAQRLLKQFEQHSDIKAKDNAAEKISHFFKRCEHEISKEPSITNVLQTKKHQQHDEYLREIKDGQQSNNERLERIEQLFTKDRYKAQLEAQEQRTRAEYEQANQAERRILEKELAALQAKFSDLQNSYAGKIKLLADATQSLERFKAQFSSNDYDAAQAALFKGDSDLAYKLFAEAELKEKDAIERAADAAYQQGKIAEDRIDYVKAYQHYQRAAQLNPTESTYLHIAGDLAGVIALYDKSIDHYEQALMCYRQCDGEDATNAAVMWNNLGSAWSSKGVYDKAIGYYEQALASDLKTFGEDHPRVATRWNNLGLAWDSKGDYDKAIGYYSKSLSVFERRLGTTHPYTQLTKNNLENAKAQFDAGREK